MSHNCINSLKGIQIKEMLYQKNNKSEKGRGTYLLYHIIIPQIVTATRTPWKSLNLSSQHRNPGQVFHRYPSSHTQTSQVILLVVIKKVEAKWNYFIFIYYCRIVSHIIPVPPPYSLSSFSLCLQQAFHPPCPALYIYIYIWLWICKRRFIMDQRKTSISQLVLLVF